MSGGRRVERQPSRGPRRAPGRRSSAAGDAARRRPRTGGRRSGLPALLPALAALLVLLAALVGTSDDPGEAPRAVPVQETRYACAGGPGLVTGQVEAGRSASARLSPGGDEVADVVDPARWVRSDLARALGRGDRSLVVTQRGEGSGGVGFVTGVLGAARGDGLVVGRCPGVVDDAWYAGLGSAQRHLGVLVLTNLSQTPAVLDVTLWSPEGPVDAVGGEGLVVEAGSTRTVRLSDLAAGEDVLGVHVARRRGAVAVAALDTSTGSAQGSELVSPMASPSRRVVLAGLVGGSVGDGPAALRVVSDEPVVASASVASDGDLSVLEDVGDWTGGALVPVGGAVGEPDLLLTAPGDAGRTVVVEGRGPDLARRDRAEVSVPAGSTVRVDLGRVLDLDGVSSVLVRSDGGVVGTAQYTAGGRQASLALQAAPVDVLTPRVRPAP